MKGSSPYTGNGSLTREQFLFHETRVTAKLMSEGLSDAEVVETIFKENLFQFPTEKSLKSLARTCIKRLHSMNDESLVQAVATSSSGTAKQICLYAMMKQYQLVWDFMATVVGEKYRTLDDSFGKKDLNTFFTRLTEQNDQVASWSEATVKKIRGVLVRILVETDYLDTNRSKTLNRVLLDSFLEERIRANGDARALAAFNC